MTSDINAWWHRAGRQSSAFGSLMICLNAQFYTQITFSRFWAADRVWTIISRVRTVFLRIWPRISFWPVHRVWSALRRVWSALWLWTTFRIWPSLRIWPAFRVWTDCFRIWHSILRFLPAKSIRERSSSLRMANPMTERNKQRGFWCHL